ncbi:hypothetical protein C5167_019980, partial [Papaver somniferum]
YNCWKQQPSLFQSSKRWAASERRNLLYQDYTSKGLTTFFGESLFGSSNTSSNQITRKQTRTAAHSENCWRNRVFFDGWMGRQLHALHAYCWEESSGPLDDGGISEEVMNELDKTRCGILVGSGMGGT